MTNGDAALPVAGSASSKQSERGERERSGVIRKRNEGVGLLQKTNTKGQKMCSVISVKGAGVSIFEAKWPIADIRNVFTCSLNVLQGFSNVANFYPEITQLP